MSNLEIVALDTSTPQLLAPQAGDGYKATLVWNNVATTFTGMLFDLTNTASAAGSKLLDMQVGGNSIFSVDPDTSSPGLTVSNASAATLFSVTNSTISGTRTLALTPAANTSALTASSYSVTGTGTTPMVDLSGAWSTTGLATLIKANLTADTGPSNAASLLMDLQQGGTSVFKVQKSSVSVLANSALTVSYTNNSVNIGASRQLNLSVNSGWPVLTDTTAGFTLTNNNAAFIWGSDTYLYRDAAGVLAQRNGANAQTFRIYNTTDAGIANYERGEVHWVGNVFRVGTYAAGTGTGRTLTFLTSGVERWSINASTGHFLAVTDNTYDIGASGASRPRNIFAGTSIFAGPTGYIGMSGRGIIGSPADSVLTLSNNGVTDFSRLQFGGTTSSFPALKRSSATLISRLADDSANAAFEAASLKTDAPAGGTAATWKLGAVSVTSPTSPNRTIEVDIGGTIYYLHAKTTND